MAELTESDRKLIQYLNEAYGKERELETALQAHIGMTDRKPYKRRLQTHLRETKGHARDVERRIKKLGGQATTVGAVASRAIATAKGPLHALRGTGHVEKMLKNAKTEYSEEAEEIATYTAIEALAESVGDRETAQLARRIRREEERMSKFLEGLIPQLTKAVARDEIPASERNGGRRRASTRRPTRGRTSATRTRSGARRGGRARSRGATRSRSASRTRTRAGSAGSRRGRRRS